MVNIIGWREYFTFVDVVDFNCFKNLCLYEMSDTAFCHNRDRYSILDSLDHFWIAHSGYTAGCTDICRDTLKCHDSTCACFLSNLCLLRCGNVHDNAAF